MTLAEIQGLLSPDLSTTNRMFNPGTSPSGDDILYGIVAMGGACNYAIYGCTPFSHIPRGGDNCPLFDIDTHVCLGLARMTGGNPGKSESSVLHYARLMLLERSPHVNV